MAPSKGFPLADKVHCGPQAGHSDLPSVTEKPAATRSNDASGRRSLHFTGNADAGADAVGAGGGAETTGGGVVAGALETAGGAFSSGLGAVSLGESQAVRPS